MSAASSAPPAEVDVVVVGFGAAGSAAAISAADLGASVVVLEKQARDAHTPSIRMSGGLVMTVREPDRATDYLDTCAQGLTPREVSAAWARRAVTLRSWLEKVTGLEFQRMGQAEHKDVAGVDAFDVLQQAGEETTWAGPRTSGASGAPAATGGELFEGLRRAVEARSDLVHLAWSTPAQRLVLEEGRVVGVRYGEGPGDVVRARRGVLLASGGFEFDEELKRTYLPASPIAFYGNPGNTGDGIRMAQAAGADLWHMNLMVGRAVMKVRRADGGEHGLLVRIAPGGYVLTDRAGRRFMNEDYQAELGHTVYYDLIGYDGVAREHPRIPAYWFFDEARRTVGPLTPPTVGLAGVGGIDWDSDNAAQVASGVIPSGATPLEAALAAGMDREAAHEAVRTLEDYNAGVAAGVDAFGRAPEGLEPIEHGPFYCVPLWPGGSNTCGGPRRDEHSRVLNPFGEQIPGLFAAGELGQVSGAWYPGAGANLSEAFCFAQIAVETMFAPDQGATHE